MRSLVILRKVGVYLYIGPIVRICKKKGLRLVYFLLNGKGILIKLSPIMSILRLPVLIEMACLMKYYMQLQNQERLLMPFQDVLIIDLFAEKGQPSQLYCLFYQEGDSFFSMSPNRESFKWFYANVQMRKKR